MKRHGPHLLQVQELIIDGNGVKVLPFNPLPDVG
jgi:circadian clock protein KaiC